MSMAPWAVISSVATILVIAVALFVSAGDVGIIEFWIYLFICAAATAAGLLLIDPELAEERRRPGGKPLGWAYYALPILPLIHWIVAGLDRGRWHLSDSVPPMLRAAGLVVVAGGYAVLIWAMHVNRFFSSIPRIQSERGHHVIDIGPYRWVRHPGYTAAILLSIASGIALGSWLATLIAVLWIPLILWRTVIEDRLLRDELPGYRDYAARVRYRLLPGLW